MSVDSRTRILTEAEQLFGQHGFAATRLSSIASAAGLGNAGLIHHFPSKAALYRSVLDSIAADLDSLYQADDGVVDALSKLESLILGMLALHRTRPGALAIIAHEFLDRSGRIEGADFLPLSGIVQDTIEIIEEGQAAGVMRKGDPVAMTAALHGTLIIGCLGRLVYSRTGGAADSGDWETELARSAIASIK